MYRRITATHSTDLATEREPGPRPLQPGRMEDNGDHGEPQKKLPGDLAGRAPLPVGDCHKCVMKVIETNRTESFVERVASRNSWLKAPEGGIRVWVVYAISWWVTYVFAVVISSFKHMYKEMEQLYGQGVADLHIETGKFGPHGKWGLYLFR